MRCLLTRGLDSILRLQYASDDGCKIETREKKQILQHSSYTQAAVVRLGLVLPVLLYCRLQAMTSYIPSTLQRHYPVLRADFCRTPKTASNSEQ